MFCIHTHIIPLSDIRYIGPEINVIKDLWKSKKRFYHNGFLSCRMGLSIVKPSKYFCPPCELKRKKYVNLSFVDENIYLSLNFTWRAKLATEPFKMSEFYGKP